MTKEYAKELTIEVWEYFTKHPEAKHKNDLPFEIYKKICWLPARCPLCAIFCTIRWSQKACIGCPIRKGKESGECSLYFVWVEAITDKDRKNAAEKIVRLVKAWKIKPTTAEAGKE
jgi:hypothetical protein